eukprot:gene17817-19595_t
MCAVGSDAAFMLERALEEMDDIFKEAEQPVSHTSRKQQIGECEITNNIKDMIDNFERILVESNFPSGVDSNEVKTLHHYSSNLSYFMLFIEDMVDHLHGRKHDDIVKELETVRREKEAFLLQVGQLSTELENSQRELQALRIAARDSFKDSDSVRSSRPTSGEVELENARGQIKSPIEDEEKRSKTPDDNNVSLKKRLREKASEVNRLKLIVNDLKSSHVDKNNAICQVQEQIEHLRQENEQLREANKAMRSNAEARHHPTEINDVNGSHIDHEQGNDNMVFQGSRSTSEPNLVRNHVRGAMSPNNNVTTPPHANGRAYPTEGRRNIIGNSFATWTMEQISEWLEDEGLAAYIPSFSKCISKGDDVFKFTNAEMEKEIGIHMPIHQKKLHFALQALQSADSDYTGRLDHNWIARWLDDIGLPQYKGVFYENRVDGRILQNMTLDDLLTLKVYTTIHHVSLKRAIQCLRHQRFHPNYLKPSLTPQNEDRCNHVMLWTNARVMDWLRSVDLAEYAPNLRGSGVHGALMILEPRFNADTLASLLSIPQNKTLLRRHLVSQFDTLLSDNCQKQKEMTARSSDFVPLNASEKHKLRKRGLPFGTLRRRKSELELDQRICPTDLDVPQSMSPPPSLDPDDVFEFSDTLSSPAISNEQDSSIENGSQIKMVGEFSQELTNLTSMLNQR